MSTPRIVNQKYFVRDGRVYLCVRSHVKLDNDGYYTWTAKRSRAKAVTA